MLFQLFVASAVLALSGVKAAPLSSEAPDRGIATSLDPQDSDCEPGELSNTTWVENNVDAFLANASQHYTEYPYDNVQALGAYLGAPNFFCGVNTWCNAGQPCSPVTLPGWYVVFHRKFLYVLIGANFQRYALMGVQGWNNYVNNLNLALTYTATILSFKLSKLVNDLWPAQKDNVTGWKIFIAWVNGVINAFPTTAVYGATAGAWASAVQGGGIISSGMMVAPSGGDQFIRWSDLANQMGSQIDEYKKAVGAYAKTVIDAPIADPKWGINKVLSGGVFLTRDNNITQDDVDNWMYKSISTNAMGLLMQTQNVYIIRTFNKTECDPTPDAIFCEIQPNNKWTERRFQKRKSSKPENKLAKKLIETYGLTKEQVLKGPTDCFDASDYEQLINPWETLTEKGLTLEPIRLCNFNVNVCNFDEAEDYGYAYNSDHTDGWCEAQGIDWV
ncbi:hypothetical protein CDEST_09433 [Colletotrichum destructivum]|uniref:DUF7872 domain-containing protein n=1 Tax=Colletotrichum destructivum TaxID=34406 RepID=A0AAX4IM38_9PEZI|nr:hypothetical protein CDEST_09433 [Colletotrichum destructivum]